MAVATRTRISLEVGHEPHACRALSLPIFVQLRKGYDVCAVLEMPASVEIWREAHRTARKRADRAERLGHRFGDIERENYEDDIFQINTSLSKRQGRPMTAAYRERATFEPLPEYPCARHAIRTYGIVSARSKLVAYLWLYRVGELALVSSILGHGEHLDDGIMFLLVQGAIERELGLGGYLVYNRADSGTEGLRWFKERCGFEPAEVSWEL